MKPTELLFTDDNYVHYTVIQFHSVKQFILRCYVVVALYIVENAWHITQEGGAEWLVFQFSLAYMSRFSKMPILVDWDGKIMPLPCLSLKQHTILLIKFVFKRQGPLIILSVFNSCTYYLYYSTYNFLHMGNWKK